MARPKRPSATNTRRPARTARGAGPKIEWLGEHPHVSAEESRAKALDLQLRRSRGEEIRLPEIEAPPPLTFKAAWELYQEGLIKEGKSPRTIADYANKFELAFCRLARRAPVVDYP